MNAHPAIPLLVSADEFEREVAPQLSGADRQSRYRRFHSKGSRFQPDNGSSAIGSRAALSLASMAMAVSASRCLRNCFRPRWRSAKHGSVCLSIRARASVSTAKISRRTLAEAGGHQCGVWNGFRLARRCPLAAAPWRGQPPDQVHPQRRRRANRFSFACARGCARRQGAPRCGRHGGRCLRR